MSDIFFFFFVILKKNYLVFFSIDDSEDHNLMSASFIFQTLLASVMGCGHAREKSTHVLILTVFFS